MRRPHLLILFRTIHLYVGIFTAPAILFFAFTGALQTFSLHETSRGSAYQPPRWIVVLAQLHKKQTTQVPVRRPGPGLASVTATDSKPPSQRVPDAPRHHPLPIKIFFLVVSIALVSSTFTGLYLSWKYRRDRVKMSACLCAGIVIPLVLIFL